MIPLMNCNQRDMQSYYSGCTVFTKENVPLQVETVNGDRNVMCSSADGTIVVLSYRDLFVQYLKPFYDTEGVVHGVQVARSYKRAPHYDKTVYSQLEQHAKGELPSTFDGEYGRVSYQFFVKPYNRKLKAALFYYNELVGFFGEGSFYVPDPFLRERLSKILGDKYVVQTCEI